MIIIKKMSLCALVSIVSCGLAACSGSSQSGGSSTPIDPPGPENQTCIPSARLQNLGSQPFLGNIYRPETQSDERFHQLWNQVTPENAGKWEAVETSRGVMDWVVLDDAVEFADSYDYGFKFHTLIAAGNTPAWLSGLSTVEQTQEITQWFDEVAARYPNLKQIDVVSEPISLPPSYIDALGGAGVTGWDWVITAFELARVRFPNSELLLNDYKVAVNEQSSADFLELVVLLQERELIDGIGVEGHFLEDTEASTVKTNLDKLSGFNLPVYLADLDVNIADDQLQLETLKALFSVFYEHPAIDGLTFWGYRENQLWRTDAYLLSAEEIDRPALDWLECYVGLEDTADSLTTTTYR